MEASHEMSQFEFNNAGEITKQVKDVESWLEFCEKNYFKKAYIGKRNHSPSKSRPRRTHQYKGSMSKRSVRSVLNIRKMYLEWRKNRKPVHITKTEAIFLFNSLLDEWDDTDFPWRIFLENSTGNSPLRLR